MREDRDTLKALSGGSLDFSSVLLGALEPHDEWPAHPLGLGVSPSELGVDIDPEPLWTMATRWYTEQADRVFIDITLDDLAAFGLVDDLGPKNVTPPGRAPLTVEQHAAIEVADGPYWAELQARAGDA